VTHWRTGHSDRCLCERCEEPAPTPQAVDALQAELALLRELEAWMRELALGESCQACAMNGAPGVEPVARVLRDAGFGPPLCRLHWDQELPNGNGSEPVSQEPHVITARRLLARLDALRASKT
jgi:hypothetical protein